MQSFTLKPKLILLFCFFNLFICLFVCFFGVCVCVYVGGGGSILILSFNMGFHSILIVDFSIPSYIQHADVKFFQSDDDEEEEEGDEEEEKQQSVISVPPVVKADKECWTQEPEFDKYV